MTKPTLTKTDLAGFTGTEHWYRHPLNPQVAYSDGARYVAQAGGAYWLLDAIALAQAFLPAVRVEPFQVWRLKVSPDRSAELVCEDGDDRILGKIRIPFTDFPLDEIDLFFADGVIFLPSEH